MSESKLFGAQLLVLGSGLALVLSMFLTWFSYAAVFWNETENGWDQQLIGPATAVIATVMSLIVIAHKSTVDSEGQASLRWSSFLVLLGVSAAALVGVRLVLGQVDDPDDWNRSPGIFVATVSSICLVMGALLIYLQNPHRTRGSVATGGYEQAASQDYAHQIREGMWCPLSPSEAATQAAGMLTRNGAVITAQSNRSLSGYFETRGTPSVLASILLFLLCIIPFIAYLLWAYKTTTEPFSLTLKEYEGGTRLRGDGQGRGLAAVHWVATELSQPREG
jgi:hypothetical protein